MTGIDSLKVKIFADGADLGQIASLAQNPLIRGFTSNPTLCKKAGVMDFVAFAKEAVSLVGDRPISFEVFADDLDRMERQARIIASWGENVYVKVPVTNTQGDFTGPILVRLAQDGIKVNVTAVMTLEQVRNSADCLGTKTPNYISIFAGRIADTGRDPMPIMREARAYCATNTELIWASPREVLNVWQANEVGCDIITATPDILAKLALAGKSLEEFSLETVAMFYHDAANAGYRLDAPAGFGSGGFGL